MDSTELSTALSQVRDEAHKLAKEKMASGEADRARLNRARELEQELATLRSDNEATSDDDRAKNDDIAQIAQRYLIFLLTEAEEEGKETLSDRAQSLHREVIAAAKLVSAGSLKGDSLKERATALSEQLDVLLADPSRSDADIEGVVGDIDLDLGYLFHEGKAPTSLALARALRS